MGSRKPGRGGMRSVAVTPADSPIGNGPKNSCRHDGKSRVTGDHHARFRGSRGLRCPRPPDCLACRRRESDLLLSQGTWEGMPWYLSLIHISEPTRLGMISYAVFCLKKKKKST